jgi:hypothetical protein
MDTRYSVYVRDADRHSEPIEIEVAAFNCYGEARSLRRELTRVGLSCVIRSTGGTGGSD